MDSTSNSTFCTDDSHPFISGNLRSYLGTGFNHSKNGNVKFFLNFLQSKRTGCITGHHNRLHLLLFQETDYLTGISYNSLSGFAAIWNSGSIAEIHDFLCWKIPSLEKLNNADLVILVLDGSKELDENDNKLLTCIDKTKTIIFVNKSDLPQKINLNLKDNVIYGSAKEVEGLSKLKEKIIDMFNLNEINKDLTYLSNVRQIDLVKKAYLSINNAKNSLSNGIPIEMISTDLKECYEFLGEIIGKTYKDDIIDRLFQDFCVGK